MRTLCHKLPVHCSLHPFPTRLRCVAGTEVRSCVAHTGPKSKHLRFVSPCATESSSSLPRLQVPRYLWAERAEALILGTFYWCFEGFWTVYVVSKGV